MFDWSSCLILGIGLLLLAFAVGIWVFEWWQTRGERLSAKHRERATRAERYSAGKEYRRTSDELDEFDASSLGQAMQRNPVMIYESMRIGPISDGPVDPLATGQLMIRLDETRAVYIDLDLAAWKPPWNHRLVEAAVWLVTRPWWARHPVAVRLLRRLIEPVGARRSKRGQ